MPLSAPVDDGLAAVMAHAALNDLTSVRAAAIALRTSWLGLSLQQRADLLDVIVERADVSMERLLVIAELHLHADRS